MKTTIRPLMRGAVLAGAVLLSSCASGPSATAAPAKPKLVVLLIVDGLPQWQFTDYRDQLAPDGLRRFMDRGRWFADAHYGHSYTVTAASHAVIMTGAYPNRTGIIGNDWRHNVTGAQEYNTDDASSTYIGHRTNKLDGTSPRKLRAETVGDVLKRADARSKVIAISGKDRGAILPAGKTGTAYMYMSQTGLYASSTYYMKEHPAWVQAYHAKKPADAYFHKEWKPLLADAAYGKSLPDGQKWYVRGGKLPKLIGEGQDTPGPLFYGAVAASPFGDALALDFARAAIAGEALGKDDATDILAVSLSTHDYVNHGYSAESRISHDHVLQLDRLLQDFFRDLDATVGKDNYVAVLTSDHGFMPSPDHSLTLGRDAGRQSGTQTVARINAALARAFGEGQWVLTISALGAVMNKPLIEERKANRPALEEETRKLLLAETGVAAAYTRTELLTGSRAGQPYFDAIRKSWHPEISGDVQFVLKPYWMMTTSSATTHGSPHPYDTHVPIAFYGPAWVKPGRVDGRVEVADIAPTLSGMLGVEPPASSEGKPLPLR